MIKFKEFQYYWVHDKEPHKTISHQVTNFLKSKGFEYVDLQYSVAHNFSPKATREFAILVYDDLK